MKELIEHTRGVDPDTGERFLFFWGAESPLSQWHPAPSGYGALTLPTAEHWMMAGKAWVFGDEEMFARITQTPSPASAKALGRKVRGFDVDVWRERSKDVVYLGNERKFSEPSLRAFLLSTEDATLVEASPLDRIWGIGLGAANPSASRRAHWRGENRLGHILTKLRADLRAGVAAQKAAQLASSLGLAKRFG